MARKIIILALVFVAIVGLVSAQAPAEAPKQSTTPTKTTSSSSSSAPPTPDTNDENIIPPTTAASPDNGVIGEDPSMSSSPAVGPSANTAEEGSIGGPVTAEAFSDQAPSSPASGASSSSGLRGVSAIVGLSAVAGLFF